MGTVCGSRKELPEETRWSSIYNPLSSIFSQVGQGEPCIVFVQCLPQNILRAPNLSSGRIWKEGELGGRGGGPQGAERLPSARTQQARKKI